jgi:hypothetical protein
MLAKATPHSSAGTRLPPKMAQSQNRASRMSILAPELEGDARKMSATSMSSRAR